MPTVSAASPSNGRKRRSLPGIATRDHPADKRAYRRHSSPFVDLIPVSTQRTRPTTRSGKRRGVTLLELVVALTLLGVVAALVVPALATPAGRRGAFDDVLRAARGVAIARAQSLTLDVGRDGAWLLRPGTAGDTTHLGSGALEQEPSVSFQLQLTPLGACLPASALPAEYGGWDAAACAPRHRAAPVAGGVR